MNVMILAAGLGTRLRPYTETTPKPALPFFSVPMVYYTLSLFEEIAIDNLVVNTHHLAEQVKALFHKINWPCQKLIFSHEKAQALGSGGGVRHAFAHLKGQADFFVVNGDEVLLPDSKTILSDMLRFHHSHKGFATLLVTKHPEVGQKFGGVWTGAKSSRVEAFSKVALKGLDGWHYTGVILLSERIKGFFKKNDKEEENLLYETLTLAMSQGEQVHIFPCQAQWFETGIVQDFTQATEFCVEALNSDDKSGWIQHFQSVLVRFSQHQYVIEKDYPGLKDAVARTVGKISR